MYNRKSKYIAFTLAELMVIMAIMTVVIAAVAPIFTSRFTNASFDNVWNTVGASDTNDIYTDAPIRSMMQQVIVGATPVDMEDVRRKFRPYSKFVIRSSNKINNNTKQKQIEFKRNGSTKGYLFAANTNLLLGANYNNINFMYNTVKYNGSTADYSHFDIGDGASGNTAFGIGALNSITKGKDNSAFGYNALNNLTTGSQNTAVGISAGSSLTTGSGNVLIGYNSYNVSTGDYNTIIGNNNQTRSTVSNYTTAIGNNINVKGNYNVAVGDSSNAGGSYNTAIGYGALESANPLSDTYSDFKYNTAIGYKSCSGISSSASNTTCIGGAGIDETTMNTSAISLFNDDKNRVLIGRGASKFGSAATLEVHGLTSKNSKYPYPGNMNGISNLGDSSVVVNGNLIVRGQIFMNGRSPFPVLPSAASSYNANTISLMGYRLYKESTLAHKPLIGVDGSEHTKKVDDADGTQHEAFTGREHCICTYSCEAGTKDYQGGKGYRGRDSYDWSSRGNLGYRLVVTNNATGDNYNYYQSPQVCGTNYNTNSHSAYNIELDMARATTNATYTMQSLDAADQRSCCPMLTPDGYQILHSTSSDLRLKNIISSYNEGLSDLEKLKIYNYTFKNDVNNTPQVGVIAQDLKRIFPNSVTKDNKGYYKIRTDEMFYAAINSVKELYSNIKILLSRINNYTARIYKLKNENNNLKNKLLLLSKELDELEK